MLASVLQVGETAVVRVKAATPDGRVARDGYAIAQFWAPGRDPRHDHDLQDHPDHELECQWDEKLRAWVAQADTSGWAPGDWTVRGLARCATDRGPAKGWSWGTLPLAP
jgi:hypothetical protein